MTLLMMLTATDNSTASAGVRLSCFFVFVCLLELESCGLVARCWCWWLLLLWTERERQHTTHKTHDYYKRQQQPSSTNNNNTNTNSTTNLLCQQASLTRHDQQHCWLCKGSYSHVCGCKRNQRGISTSACDQVFCCYLFFVIACVCMCLHVWLFIVVVVCRWCMRVLVIMRTHTNTAQKQAPQHPPPLSPLTSISTITATPQHTARLSAM